MFNRRQFIGSLGGLLLLRSSAQAHPFLAFGKQVTTVQPSSSIASEANLCIGEQLVTYQKLRMLVSSIFEIEARRVASTGSMRPAIGDGDAVILEKAPYDDLQIGDIVLWEDPHYSETTQEGVVALSRLHRIWGGRPGCWVSRGDNNTEADDLRITPERYRARVRRVLYSEK